MSKKYNTTGIFTPLLLETSLLSLFIILSQTICTFLMWFGIDIKCSYINDILCYTQIKSNFVKRVIPFLCLLNKVETKRTNLSGYWVEKSAEKATLV